MKFVQGGLPLGSMGQIKKFHTGHIGRAAHCFGIGQGKTSPRTELKDALPLDIPKKGQDIGPRMAVIILGLVLVKGRRACHDHGFVANRRR